jgi:hypothetical protein
MTLEQEEQLAQDRRWWSVGMTLDQEEQLAQDRRWWSVG